MSKKKAENHGGQTQKEKAWPRGGYARESTTAGARGSDLRAGARAGEGAETPGGPTGGRCPVCGAEVEVVWMRGRLVWEARCPGPCQTRYAVGETPADAARSWQATCAGRRR
mgnify:CR=1 FL=1